MGDAAREYEKGNRVSVVLSIGELFSQPASCTCVHRCNQAHKDICISIRHPPLRLSTIG